MPRCSVVAALGLFLAVFSPSAHALELNYTWKTGDVHRFRYQEDTQFKLPAVAGLDVARFGGGSAGALNIQVRTTFAEHVLQTSADGSARVELRIEQIEVTQGKGNTIDALALLPEAARTVRAEIDRKGHVRPERSVVIYQHDGRYFLGAQVGGKVEGGISASASASATLPNGQRVEIYAALDLQGGKVSGGVRAAGNAAVAKTAKITADDPTLDVLPRRLFDLMVLPEGSLAPGSTTELKLPAAGTSVRISCAALQGSVAPLRYQVGSAVAVSSAAPAPAPTPFSGAAPAVPRSFPAEGLPVGRPPGTALGEGDSDPTAGFAGADPAVGGVHAGLGETSGEDAVFGARLKKNGRNAGAPAVGGGGVSTALQFAMDLRSRFDVAAGKLLEISGTVHTATRQGNAAGVGAGITVDATITLTRL